MIRRFQSLSLPRRHPRQRVVSEYLDGDLQADDRHRVEIHLRDCALCRRRLASLEQTLRVLGTMREDASAGLADSIIEKLRAENPPEVSIPARSRTRPGVGVLTVVPSPGQPPTGSRVLPWPAAAGLRWCLQRPQLRLTLPVALVAGVVLSLVNMGGMLMHGRIDLGVCVSCALDFLVPFFALNLVLLMLLWLPGRKRIAARAPRDRSA